MSLHSMVGVDTEFQFSDHYVANPISDSIVIDTELLFRGLWLTICC